MHPFLHYRGPKPEFSELQMALALKRAELVDPKSPEFKDAQKIAVESLARLVLAQSIVEQDEARAAELSAQHSADAAAARMEAKRAPWITANVSNMKALSAFWAAAFGQSLMSLPVGADGYGRIADLRAVHAGREWLYGQIPTDHAAIIGAHETLALMDAAHGCAHTLSWTVRGVEHRLYHCGRARLNVQTPRLTIVSSNSGMAGAIKLPLSGATWTTPPAQALGDGADKLPALPAAVVEAFGRFAPDGAGANALENFLLGRS